jgi:hypothetical protein
LEIQAKNPGSADGAIGDGLVEEVLALSMSKAEPAAITAQLDSNSVAQLKTMVAQLKVAEEKNKT